MGHAVLMVNESRSKYRSSAAVARSTISHFALEETSYHTWPLGSGFPTLLMNCGLFAAAHRALRARRDIRQRAGLSAQERAKLKALRKSATVAH